MSNFDLSPASLWILEKYNQLELTLQKHTEDLELAHCVQAIYEFVWDFYADWYVEYLKTDESQIVFAKELYRQTIITISPYIPFESEAIWQQFYRASTTLSLEVKDMNWSTHLLLQYDTKSSNEFVVIKEFIQNIRSLRGLFAIDPGTFIKIYSVSEILIKYRKLIGLLSRAEFQDTPGNYDVEADEYSYSINILDYIKDLEGEAQRTLNTITSLEKQLLGINSQLGNKVFMANADSSTIQEKLEQHKSRNGELGQQQKKLKFLQQNT